LQLRRVGPARVGAAGDALGQAHAGDGAVIDVARVEDVALARVACDVGHERHDPAVVLTRLCLALEPGGLLIVSLFRSGNSTAVWRRIERRFHILHDAVVSLGEGEKTWDIRSLVSATAAAKIPFP